MMVCCVCVVYANVFSASVVSAGIQDVLADSTTEELGNVEEPSSPPTDSSIEDSSSLDVLQPPIELSGPRLESWQGEDLRPGRITASQGPHLGPRPSRRRVLHPRHHGSAHPAGPCDCESCQTGPMGLGLSPWLHDLLRFDQGPFKYEDRGPGPYEDWSHRPYALSFLAGLWTGDTLIDGQLETSSSGLWEVRAAHSITDEFVIEARFARASPKANSLISGNANGEVDVIMGDVTAQFALANRYFFQTQRWQPYLTFGGGFATFDFVNLNGVQVDETVFVVPIGAGFRYRYSDAWAFRFEFRDNIAPGGPLASMHNMTLVGGAEWRFGGSRPSYGMWDLR